MHPLLTMRLDTYFDFWTGMMIFVGFLGIFWGMSLFRYITVDAFWSPKIIQKPRKPEETAFTISISHPEFLSKRFTSSFIVQIYLPDMRREVTEKLKTQFGKQTSIEHVYDSSLTIGSMVKIKLFCPVIVFSDPVTKKLDSKLNTISLLGKPNDNCYPGVHQATLSIFDERTSYEYQSMNFSAQITDFAFDHVSHPLLSKLMTTVLSIGSLTMFILTLLGQIDVTFGLASGATTGLLASTVYARFISLYHAPTSSYP